MIKYETPENKTGQTIAAIILVILVILFGLFCTPFSSEPKYLPEEDSSYQYDGHL